MLFDKRLSQLRKEKGISQKECAETLGIESSKYNKWENGKNCPDYETVCMLANFFDTTTDYLLGNSENRHRREKEALKDWQNKLIAHITNKFISFFKKYNEYKKGDNTMALKNIFTLAILGQMRKCVDSQTALLENISKINECKDMSEIDRFLNRYSSELGEVNVGGQQDNNGVWVNSISEDDIIRTLRDEVERKVPEFKNYKKDLKDDFWGFSLRFDDED